MASVKIILTHPHIETRSGFLQYCAAYRFTEAINGVMDGQVGYEPASGLTEAQILDQLKALAVDHANLQTSNATGFTSADVITWEAS